MRYALLPAAGLLLLNVCASRPASLTALSEDYDEQRDYFHLFVLPALHLPSGVARHCRTDDCPACGTDYTSSRTRLAGIARLSAFSPGWMMRKRAATIYYH
jgi:hypothetical protein